MHLHVVVLGTCASRAEHVEDLKTDNIPEKDPELSSMYPDVDRITQAVVRIGPRQRSRLKHSVTEVSRSRRVEACFM